MASVRRERVSCQQDSEYVRALIHVLWSENSADECGHRPAHAGVGSSGTRTSYSRTPIRDYLCEAPLIIGAKKWKPSNWISIPEATEAGLVSMLR